MRISAAVFFVLLMFFPAYGIEDTKQNVSGSDNQVIRTDDGDVTIRKNYFFILFNSYL